LANCYFMSFCGQFMNPWGQVLAKINYWPSCKK
jgi:hypothetical protein